jgi:hypothetical protein
VVFRYFRYKIMSFVNRDSLTSSLLICIPFISSSLSHSFGWEFQLCWIQIEKLGTLALFLILGEMVSVFFPISMMLAIGLAYIAWIMLRYIPYIPSFITAFIMKGYWILLKAFSVSIEMIMLFIVFASVNMVYYI